MKRLILTLILSLIYSIAGFSQSLEVDKKAQDELEKLSFIVGQWEGEGWMMGRDGTKHTFTQTENVQYKLDNTAILIEGIGTSGGQIIHNALAVVRFNHEDADYTFNSYLATGQTGEFKGEIMDGKFYWFPNENMRYIIELNEDGHWLEVGEINQNGSWFQFFEMRLEKV